jgi:hypothetical protein
VTTPPTIHFTDPANWRIEAIGFHIRNIERLLAEGRIDPAHVSATQAMLVHWRAEMANV